MNKLKESTGLHAVPAVFLLVALALAPPSKTSATLPSSNIVTVRVVSWADTSATGSISVTLQNPAPVLAGIAPASVPAGAFAITVNGSGFVSGAQVLLAGAPLATTFVASTQPTAAGNEPRLPCITVH